MRFAISGFLGRLLNLCLGVLALLLFTFRCTYDPGDEITFRSVEQIPAVATISLDDISEGDTIILYQSTDIQFSAGVDKGEIRQVEARVDGRAIESYVSYDGKGRLRIYVGYGGLATGTYMLSLKIISSSATNSIADKLGSETVTTTQAWRLKVDIDPPPPPILHFSESNGFLKVSWDPYLKKNFTSYQLTYGTEVSNYNKTRTIQITDPLQSFWIDSSYVTGFPLKFELSTNTVYSSNVGREVYQHMPKLIMQYESADSTVILSWTKPKFDHALKSYVVIENGIPRAELDNINDTTYRFKIDAICGQRSSLSVSFMPLYHGYREWLLDAEVAEPVSLETVAAPLPFTYNVTLNKLFAFDYNTSQVFSYNDDFTIAGKSQLSGNNPSIPSQGNYGYYIEANSVVRFDLTTGEKTAHQELGEILGTYIASSSSTGLVSMTGTIRWAGGHRAPFTQIKQFSADEFIYFRAQSIYESSPPPAAILSDDGQYVYFHGTGELHRVSTAGLMGIGYVFGIVDYRADDNGELIARTTGGDVRIYNTADVSLKRTIPVPEPGFEFHFYDPVSNTLLFQSPTSWVKYIVNLETGQTRSIKSVKVQSYINGSIFLDNIHYKKLL